MKRRGRYSSRIVWALSLILVFQHAALAAPARTLHTKSTRSLGSTALPQAGSSYFDSSHNLTLIRVTDARDGESISVPDINASSFNRNSSNLILNCDKTAVLYALSPTSLSVQKTRTLFDSTSIEVETCRWSAGNPDQIFGLQQTGRSPKILAYSVADNAFSLVKDFSNVLPEGEAQQFGKALLDDNTFTFVWRADHGSDWRYVVVYDRQFDSLHFFDLQDPTAGVSGFTGAHLDRAGRALVVNGSTTRVWRFLTTTQAASTRLEQPENNQSRFSVDINAQLESRSSEDLDPISFPRGNVSRDGRFAVFNSSDATGRQDVYLAAGLQPQSETAAGVLWTNNVNCAATENLLRKTAGNDNSDDAYAMSLQTVDEGDAFVEFTASATDKERWCGFNSSSSLHQSTGDIDFALRLTSGRKVLVVEEGVVKAKTKYKSGNTLRVAVESGVVNYYRNGSVFYTSTARPEYPLSVNASLLSADSSIENAVVSGASVKTFVSITPSKVTISTGQALQFSGVVSPGGGGVNWSASHGTITSTGLFTAPAVAGTCRVIATAQSNPRASAIATVTVTAPADKTPPVINQIAVSNVTATGATISWLTNEAADSVIQYGTTTAYGSVVNSSTLATAHALSLAGLSAQTVYHFRVKSRDVASNVATSADASFTTAAAADVTPPVISAVAASNISTSAATITWSTNESSDSQVEYGTATSYGSVSPLAGLLTTAHSVALSGLASGTVYRYRVKSRDVAGNLATSADSTFTTVASAPPPPSGGGSVKTDYGVYPEPAPPALPAAGGTFVDPTFGTTIMRVTDENDGIQNTTNYSYWHSFNINSTRLYIIAGDSPTLYTFDPVNFRISGKRALYINRPPVGGSPRGEDSIWSGTDPDVMYGHDGLIIWAYNVASNTYTLVKDLSSQLPPGYLWQMSKSVDDNVFAFTTKDPTAANTGYCAWRRDTDSLLYNGTMPDLDEVQVDKTGQWLVVKTGHAGAGVVRVQVVNLLTRSVDNLVDGTPDFAPGHSDNGNGFIVGYDNWNNRVTYRRAATPHQLYSALDFGNDWSIEQHISMLESDDAWALMSTFVGNSLPSSGVFKDELVLFATDGSKQVRRFAHTHSVYRDYWDTPRATISRDGKFAAFTSNWGSTTRRDVFVARVPGASSSSTPPPPPPPADTTPPVISAVSSSGATTSGATIRWSTNESSDSQVEYGTSTSYGSTSGLDTQLVTTHAVNLSGLSAGTTYHYRVKSRDASGNLAVSPDFTFSTSSVPSGGSSGLQSVIWTSVVNCLVSGNSLQKNGGYADTPDAGGRSQQSLSGGDGYVEFTVTEANSLRFLGFTHSVSGTDYAAINFAIKLTTFGVAEVREGNVYRTETTYAAGDVFRVAVSGGVVKYSKNGTVFYTSNSAPTYPLVVDASLLTMSSTITKAVVSGQF